MISGAKRGRRLVRQETGSYWISFSDMLSSLLMVFVLALCFSIYQYYSQLDLKTQELNAQKTELDRTQIVLAAQEKELETSRVVLMGKEEELASIQIQLDVQQSDLFAAQTSLKTKEDEQAALQLQLAQQSDTLALQAVELGAMQQAMTSQAQQIDELLGLRTEIIRELSKSLSAAALGVKVDPTTGDIILDSQLMFASGQDVISISGQAQLYQLIPVYLSVLTRPEYKDYVAEIIVEGHTDSNGGYLFNLELSQTRALSVAKYALELGSLDVQQRALLQDILTAKGRSYSNPVLNADGTENMDSSRRVEIKFRLKDTEMIQRMNEILVGMGQP